MKIAMIGLGKMGANMVRRLLRAGHECVVYDLDPASVAALAAEGAIAAASLEDVAARLEPPRAAWVMVPAGAATEQAIAELGAIFATGDVIIDGGNTFYKDDVRRAGELARRGIDYVDVGTSGGVWGLELGYCLMYGGAPAVVARLEPIFRTLAPGPGGVEPTAARAGKATTADQGYLHCGPVGSGHFVKMVHNGIEYGIMQAYAEGFDILRTAGAERIPPDRRYELDLADVAELWRRGSVVRSWLLDLTANALHGDPALAAYSGVVNDSGEGRWTIDTAVEQATPVPVLAASLFARFRSRQEATFGDKLLSAMRHQFGGHREPPKVE